MDSVIITVFDCAPLEPPESSDSNKASDAFGSGTVLWLREIKLSPNGTCCLVRFGINLVHGTPGACPGVSQTFSPESGISLSTVSTKLYLMFLRFPLTSTGGPKRLLSVSKAAFSLFCCFPQTTWIVSSGYS